MVVLIVVLREPFGTLAANAARGMCPRPGVVGVVLPATAAPAKLSRRLLPRPPLHAHDAVHHDIESFTHYGWLGRARHGVASIPGKV